MSYLFYRSEIARTLLPIVIVLVGAVIVGMDVGNGNFFSIPLLLVGGLIGMYLLLRYPFVSFLVLMIATWYDSINPFIVGGFTLNRVMAFAILIAVVLRHILSDKRERLIFTRFDFFMGLYILLSALTLMFYGEGIRTEHQLSAFVIGYFYYWFAINLIDDERKLQILGAVLILSTLPIAATVILEATNSERGTRFSGIQAYGDTATLSVMAIMFSAYLALGRAYWVRLLALGLSIMFALALVLTGTRGALIGLFGAFITIIAFLNVRLIIPLLIIGGIVFSISLQVVEQIAPTVLERFAFIEEGADAVESELSWVARVEVYERALQAFAHNPLIGVGYGHLWNWGNFSRSSHNIYLNTLGETGVIGFVPLLAAVGYVAFGLIREIRRAPDSITRRKWIILLGILVFYNVVYANFNISTIGRGIFFVFGITTVPLVLSMRAQAAVQRASADQARAAPADQPLNPTPA